MEKYQQQILAKRLYTINEAAMYLGRPIFTLRTLIWEGYIPVVKTGRRYYIDYYDLEEFIEKNKTKLK